MTKGGGGEEGGKEKSALRKTQGKLQLLEVMYIGITSMLDVAAFHNEGSQKFLRKAARLEHKASYPTEVGRKTKENEF